MLARSVPFAPIRIPFLARLSSTFLSSPLSDPKLPRQCRHQSTLPDLPIFRALDRHDPQSTAVLHADSGRSFTYGNLIGDVLRAQDNLNRFSPECLRGKPVAFLAENSYDYVGNVNRQFYPRNSCMTKLKSAS